MKNKYFFCYFIELSKNTSFTRITFWGKAI